MKSIRTECGCRLPSTYLYLSINFLYPMTELSTAKHVIYAIVTGTLSTRYLWYTHYLMDSRNCVTGKYYRHICGSYRFSHELRNNVIIVSEATEWEIEFNLFCGNIECQKAFFFFNLFVWKQYFYRLGKILNLLSHTSILSNSVHRRGINGLPHKTLVGWLDFSNLSHPKTEKKINGGQCAQWRLKIAINNKTIKKIDLHFQAPWFQNEKKITDENIKKIKQTSFRRR